MDENQTNRNESLAPEELAYHQTVFLNLTNAQAAYQSWAQHLANRYRLKEQDVITADGEIVRGLLEDGQGNNGAGKEPSTERS